MEDELYSTGRVSPLSRPMSSVRSLASVDTNVLLGDTDDVMNAIGRKKRISDDFDTNRTDGDRGLTNLSLSLNHHDTDSEGEDTYTGLNGTSQISRQERLLKSKSLDSGALPPKAVLNSDFAGRRAKNMSTREKVMRHMASRSGNRKVGFPTEFEDLGHSDGHSESEGYSESASYTSTDISEMASRGGRPGSAKAAMSNTRVNRAFALRQARAVGSEPDTGFRTPAKARTSSTGRDHSRPSSAKDTSRTDMSLGAQIVKKSRDNNSRAKSTSPFQRTEGGRNSWRDKKTGGIPTRKVPESKLPKGQSSGGLAITGQKSEASRPQSAKTAEYSAWRRRKDYDPRRAAAEAKKPKDTTKKTDGSRLRMQRSQSMGAPADTGRRARSATNSSVSSMSSDDFAYDHDPQLNSNRTSEISKMSSALATNLDSLSRSLGGESGEVLQVKFVV